MVGDPIAEEYFSSTRIQSALPDYQYHFVAVSAVVDINSTTENARDGVAVAVHDDLDVDLPRDYHKKTRLVAAPIGDDTAAAAAAVVESDCD